MTGKILTLVLVLSALIGGVAMYYLQVYAFYDEIPADVADVQVTSLSGGAPEPIVFENFKGIDATSSPLRYRACFDTTLSTAMMSETYVVYDDPVPNVAPGWFDCFDAVEVGEALEAGTAMAFLGTANVVYGIDRVVAVMDDGRGFVWHQINRCGTEVFDGNPPPEGCPPQPGTN